jgi:hypothetical protein
MSLITQLHSLHAQILGDRDVFYVADPVSSIRSERFLRFFARTHDRPKRFKP